MRCKWCKDKNGSHKGYCFNCYLMGTIQALHCKIEFKHFDNILNRLDEINFSGFLLTNRVHFFQSPWNVDSRRFIKCRQ